MLTWRILAGYARLMGLLLCVVIIFCAFVPLLHGHLTVVFRVYGVFCGIYIHTLCRECIFLFYTVSSLPNRLASLNAGNVISTSLPHLIFRCVQGSSRED